jgi:hypothetical protein
MRSHLARGIAFEVRQGCGDDNTIDGDLTLNFHACLENEVLLHLVTVL